VARASGFECGLRDLEAPIDVSAAERVEGVIGPREQAAPEAIRHEVDRPVDDLAGAAKTPLEKSPAGSEIVEAHPAIDAFGPERYERVETVGVRRPRGESKDATSRLSIRLVDRDRMARFVFRTERVVDGGHPARGSADEKLAHSRRWWSI
jgi:hypothetical protein